MVIPKIIHQTWKTTSVPEHWRQSFDNCQKLVAQEGWEYKLWTDDDNRNLIKSFYPWFLTQYDTYEKNIHRADVVRYFILHRYGGIYMDLDIAPKTNGMFTAFYELYKNYAIGLGGNKDGNAVGDQIYTNAFMMSSPRHAFWPHVWGLLKDPFRVHPYKKYLARSDYFNVLFRTGSSMLSDAANTFQTNKTTDVLFRIPAALIQPGDRFMQPPVSTPESVVTILPGSSWHERDASFFNLVGDCIYYREYIYLGLFAFFFVMFLFMCVLYARAQRKHVVIPSPKAIPSRPSSRSKSSSKQLRRKSMRGYDVEASKTQKHETSPRWTREISRPSFQPPPPSLSPTSWRKKYDQKRWNAITTEI